VWFGWGQANASAGLRAWLAGAAVLAVAGQSDFIPVWVCAVVGAHFFPLASLLQDRQLVVLGVSVTTVALVALVAGLTTGLAPSTVTGVGAGTLLTGFALAALAGARDNPGPVTGVLGSGHGPSGQQAVQDASPPGALTGAGRADAGPLRRHPHRQR
jgi:hypothetical protein